MREKITADEASMVENISTRNRVLKASIPGESPPPKEVTPEEPEQEQAMEETQPGTIEPEPETKIPQPKRETSKRKRGQAESYDEVFLKRKELKARQSVYISQEIHGSIARLVHILALAGKDISVGGYIDNVLAEHMESHKDVIAEMWKKRIN